MELTPILNSRVTNDVDRDLIQLFVYLFKTYLAQDADDVMNVALPEKGSLNLLRRAMNDNGFVLMENANTDLNPNYENNIRMIFNAWRGRNFNGRGLAFLTTLINTLYPGAGLVEQLWQPKSQPYGTGLFSETENPDTSNAWLTSRVRVTIASSENLAALRGLINYTIPARFVIEYVLHQPSIVAGPAPDNFASIDPLYIGV